MDVTTGARVVSADGQWLGMVQRRERDYFEARAEDGTGYWLNFDTIESTDSGASTDGEVRLRINAGELDHYRVEPASVQSVKAREADTLEPGPVGRLATAGGGGEEEFSEDLASDIAARRGTPDADVVPEQLAGRQRERGASEGSERD